MKLRIVLIVCLMATIIPVSADAQEKPRSQTPRVVEPSPRPPTTLLPSGRRLRGRDVNIQIELTITDVSATGSPDKKVVSVTTADGTMGRIRTGAGDTALNIDATPSIIANDRIVLELAVVYAPPVPAAAAAPAAQAPRPATVNEMLSVVLHDGRSMMVSQAADPTTARRLTVEVKATIVK